MIQGNKGGVSIRLELHSTSVCFINAHLAAHVEECERRNQDFHDIIARLSFANFMPPKTIKHHECVLNTLSSLFIRQCYNNNSINKVRFSFWIFFSLFFLLCSQIFWLGDLNYRLVGVECSSAKEMIDKGHWADLWPYDQLKQMQKEGRAFLGFSEAQLDFKPTYKYANGSDEWDE